MDRAELSRRLRPRPVVVLCAVTLLIWTNRIPLAWTNDEDTLTEKLVWTVPITLFELAALAVLAALLRGVPLGRPWLLRTARAFAAATVAYWAVRAPMILLGDWSLGFKVVHAVLAVASAAAAVVALRSTTGVAMPPGGTDAGPGAGPVGGAPRGDAVTTRR